MNKNAGVLRVYQARRSNRRNDEIWLSNVALVQKERHIGLIGYEDIIAEVLEDRLSTMLTARDIMFASVATTNQDSSIDEAA